VVATALPPAPPPPSGAQPVRPVVVTTTVVPPTPGSSSFPPPPPPPPPPRPPRRLFRRFLIYTAVGALTFYPLSGYVSTKSETYRELFTANIPGGEFVADYADDHHWENFGVGTVSKKAVQGWQGVTGDTNTPKDKVADARQTISRKTDQAINKVEKVAGREGSQAKSAAIDAKDKAVTAAQDASAKAKSYAAEATEKAKALATEASDKAKHLATEASDKAKSLASQASSAATGMAAGAKDKVEEATEKVPAKFSEGVEGIVRQAEKALHTVEDEAVKAEKAVAPQPTGPRSLPDTQRPRELHPESVDNKAKSDPTIGKELYKGPALPLGFEPPPGYYIAPPKKVELPAEGAPLPLLAPQVKDFASEEPIIAQLASTIDSLTSSLSSANAGSANATGILTKAHDDLSALSSRLGQVKKNEKEKLEKTISEKTKEFESLLKTKAEEAKKGEQGLKAGWEQERQQMVDKWREELEGELETQRSGIDKRYVGQDRANS
jgi:mitofilin